MLKIHATTKPFLGWKEIFAFDCYKQKLVTKSIEKNRKSAVCKEDEPW